MDALRYSTHSSFLDLLALNFYFFSYSDFFFRQLAIFLSFHPWLSISAVAVFVVQRTTTNNNLTHIPKTNIRVTNLHRLYSPIDSNLTLQTRRTKSNIASVFN